MTDSYVLHTICPFCGTRHDRVCEAKPDSDAFPRNGDVTICFSCGEACVFADVDGGLRKPSKKEQREFARDETLIKARTVWREIKQS